MSKILVISGHPHLDRSNMNAAILESLEDKFNGDILEVRRLDELYPDFNIDAKAEQEALVDADIIVLQFPIYWYNVPSLLKKWIEDVLEYGFAYGSSGTALHGKKLLLSFTAGSGADVYHEKMAHDLPDFMPAFQETAALTGMEWQEPVYSYGALTDAADRLGQCPLPAGGAARPRLRGGRAHPPPPPAPPPPPPGGFVSLNIVHSDGYAIYARIMKQCNVEADFL